MTGYGRGSAVGSDFSIAVEVKTVNNRFLDINLRMSSELQAFENDLKKAISDRLKRGRVDVNIQFERSTPVEYDLNRPLISGYLTAMKELQEEFGLAGDPDLAFISRLPNALLPKPAEIDDEFADGLSTALGKAVEGLQAMRTKEGSSLRLDLEELLTGISDTLPTIEKEAENVAGEYLERLDKRIGKLLTKSESQIELDQARLAQEVAYLADKSDISEEIARLKSHIEQFSSIMDETGSIGKRLDFLTQELNREANTIASKTQNLVVKESALRIKGDIEKIREQVQNVE